MLPLSFSVFEELIALEQMKYDDSNGRDVPWMVLLLLSSAHPSETPLHIEPPTYP
jgi:hypothetical protein